MHRTTPWLRGAMVSLWGVGALAMPLRGAEPPPAPLERETGATVELNGLSVTLFKPRVVARSRGFLWFPTLVRLGDGSFVAVMSDYPDQHTRSSTCLTALSRDGALTWGEPRAAVYSDAHVILRDGDVVLLPYYLYPREDGGGLQGPQQRVRRGEHAVEAIEDRVTVTGWPRPPGSLDPNLGLGGFVFNGQTVRLKDGGYLATLYGYFEGDKRYSLVAAASDDGVNWAVRSIVADEKCKLPGAEGPCEAALCRLKDGRLMCVYRMGGDASYGQSFSSDEGRTWTEPASMGDGVGAVQPSLAVMPDGMVVLSGGRPGVNVWFNVDGAGKDWQPLHLAGHHNAFHPEEPINNPTGGGDSSAYTEVVALDDTNLAYIYDRIPRGWTAIPEGSAETNSVWVMRVELKAKN